MIFTALAQLLYRLRHGVIALWIISLLMGLLYLLIQQPQISRSPLKGATNTEAYRVEQALKSRFGYQPAASAALVIRGDSPLWQRAEARAEAAVEQLMTELQRDYPQLNSLQRVPSREAHVHQLYFLTFKNDITLPEAQKVLVRMRQSLRSWEAQTDLQGYFTGSVGFMYDTNEAAHSESAVIEKIAMGLALIILLFNFGSPFAALLPILMGASSLLYLSVLSDLFALPMTPITMVLNSMVCLALAIDYSLFIVSRFREELHGGASVEQALRETLQQAGETILFSALIMLSSIAVLLIPEVSSSRIVVQGLGLVILLSLLVSVVVLPALLTVGHVWLERPAWLVQRLQPKEPYRFWRRFSGHVVNYPVRYFILSLALLLGLAAPALQMRLWEPIVSVTPEQSESYRGYKALEQDRWGGELLPVNIMVHSPDGRPLTAPEHLQQVEALSQHMESHPKVQSVLSLTRWRPDFDLPAYTGFYNTLEALKGVGLNPGGEMLQRILSPDRQSTVLNIYPDPGLDIQDSYAILDYARAYDAAHPEIQMDTGGIVARAQDFTYEIYRHVPLMLTCIVCGILVILFVYMRTPVLPLKAAFMNFMPILGAYGVLTLAFQDGWLQGILQSPYQGGITSIVPVILFCIVFGLSMDYEVLILSRISEAYHKGQDVKEAVVEGLTRSGSVITGAAFILLGVFVPGIFADSPLIREIALGLTAAIVLDATVLRLFLVPSFMVLMGRWNWWTPFRRAARSEQQLPQA